MPASPASAYTRSAAVTETTRQPLEDILDHLRLRYDPPPSQTAVITIATLAPSRSFKYYHLPATTPLSKIAERIVKFPPSLNVYTRPALLTHTPPTGAGTTDLFHSTNLLWVDIDAHPSSGNRVPMDRAYFALFNTPDLPPPTAVVDSGSGYHAYWRLRTPITDPSQLKRILAWITAQIGPQNGADPAAVDAVRCLRIPGTMNAKPQTRRLARTVYKSPTATYLLEDFGEVPAFALPQDIPQYEPTPLEPTPDEFLDRVREQKPLLADRILSEQTARSSQAPLTSDFSRVDRSSNDWYVAVELLRLGYAPNHVASVLTHPTWFAGSKFRDRYNSAYVNKTIAEANRVVRDLPTGVQRGKTYPAIVGEDIIASTQLLAIGEQLFRYDDRRGVYRPDGEQFVRAAAYGRIKNAWQLHTENAILAFVRNRTKERSPDPEAYEHSPFINTAAGMLHLETRKVYPHGPEYRSTSQVPVRYDPRADSTPAKDFVATILQPEDIRPFWQLAGYILWDVLEYKLAAIFYGPPNTGKSQILNLLEGFVGYENVCSVEPGELEIRFRLAEFVGKMLNVCHEMNAEAAIKRAADIKRLADGTPITVEYKGKNPFKFRNRAKLVYAANVIPKVGSNDAGVYERYLPFDCRNVFTATAGNARPRIGELLIKDHQFASGMLNAALDGLDDLRTEGDFTRSTASKAIVADARKASDSVLGFWIDATTADATYRAPISVFYDAYWRYCDFNNYKQPRAKPMFGKRTAELFGELGLRKEYNKYTTPSGVATQHHSYWGRKIDPEYLSQNELEMLADMYA